jgi:hypothetical protein
VREGEDERLLDKGRTDRPRPASAVAELAAVRAADREVKATARDRKTGAAAGAAKRSRKPAPARAAPRPRTRR